MAKKPPNKDAGSGDNVVPLKPAPDQQQNTGLADVRDALTQGRRRTARVRERPRDPVPGDPLQLDGQDIPPGGWMPDRNGLAPGCPIGVLGKDGDQYYLVDTLCQLRMKTAEQLGQKTVQDLFGSRQAWLYWAFPGRDRSGKVVRWDNVKFHEMLASAAEHRGLWSPVDNVRGRGAWAGADGKLWYHAGDAIYREGRFGEQPLAPGEYDGRFYPARPRIPPPYMEKMEGNPAAAVFAGLKSWNWERPAIDPFLLIGVLGTGLIGGALAWRPTTFVVGDYGVGKSHLNRFLSDVMGAALLTSKNATSASLYRLVGHDSLAIALDELEASADNRRVSAIVDLARLAADGAKLYRTAGDGTAAEFTVNGAFFFSAINQPPLEAADFSRMIVLNLKRLDETSSKTAPAIRNPNVGRMLLRRLMDEWHRFAPTFDAYREALAKGGHSARGQDTFGTALALADLLLGPNLMEDYGYPVETLDAWGEWLAAGSLTELQNARDNWHGCLMHLLTSRVEAWRDGTRRQVGQVLHDLEDKTSTDPLDIKYARQWLHQAGLGITDKWLGELGYVLAVPHAGSLVGALFRDTKWHGQGAVGVWSGALHQGPASVVLTKERVRGLMPGSANPDNWNVVKIAGVPQRCTLISLKGFREWAER